MNDDNISTFKCKRFSTISKTVISEIPGSRDWGDLLWQTAVLDMHHIALLQHRIIHRIQVDVVKRHSAISGIDQLGDALQRVLCEFTHWFARVRLKRLDERCECAFRLPHSDVFTVHACNSGRVAPSGERMQLASLIAWRLKCSIYHSCKNDQNSAGDLQLYAKKTARTFWRTPYNRVQCARKFVLPNRLTTRADKNLETSRCPLPSDANRYNFVRLGGRRLMTGVMQAWWFPASSGDCACRRVAPSIGGRITSDCKVNGRQLNVKCKDTAPDISYVTPTIRPAASK